MANKTETSPAFWPTGLRQDNRTVVVRAVLLEEAFAQPLLYIMFIIGA
jgi:hypothetical protein